MADAGDTLRTLAELGPSLRAAGFASVTLPDGLSFTLRPHVEPLAEIAPSAEDDEPDPDDELEGEAKEIADGERGWKAYWERMTRSSGAPIPKFPGIEAYRKVAAGLGVRA